MATTRSTALPPRGGLSPLQLLGGLRSACTYVGAGKLKELCKRTTFIRVTQQVPRVPAAHGAVRRGQQRPHPHRHPLCPVRQLNQVYSSHDVNTTHAIPPQAQGPGTSHSASAATAEGSDEGEPTAKRAK